MALRTRLGCLPLAALALCASIACKDKSDAEKRAVDLDKRCEQLAMVCGDKDQHVEKLVAECVQAGAAQVAKGCADQAIAVYDCYEKELCGSREKVWALDDFRVLTERHRKCVAERDALRACVEK